jgi:hypothetical protein
VYVRAYNVTASRWHQAALRQGAGRFRARGLDLELSFTPVEGEINDRIDAAYSEKYASSAYLPPMISTGPRRHGARRLEVALEGHRGDHSWKEISPSPPGDPG